MTRAEILTIAASGIAFCASVIATVVSVYNARLGRFVSERWWERRADAYTRVIEALSELVEQDSRYYDDALHVRKLTDEETARYRERWQVAEREVAKATNIGAFMLSPHAKAILRARAAETAESVGPNWMEAIERDYVADRKALDALVECAAQDLRVR